MGGLSVLTIAVTVKVHDGIVFASDSATTLVGRDENGREEVMNVYNNANKIFNLHKSLPIGAITFDAGAIGQSSIATLAKDLREKFGAVGDVNWHVDTSAYSIEEVVDKTRHFLFEEKFNAALSGANPPGNLGFWVGGYSSQSETSELWDVSIIDGKCEPKILKDGTGCGVNWAGQPEAITRLLLGFGTALPEALVDMGLPPEKMQDAVNMLRSRLAYELCSPPMPIQDAIELAMYLVETTIGFTRFKVGAATVGGPVEIAAVTRHEGFKWVRRKHYFEARLNPITEKIS